MRHNRQTSGNSALKAAIIVYFAFCFAPGLLHGEESAAAPAPAPVATEPAAPSDRTAPDPSLIRVTSSVESKYASAMLRQVAHLFSAGFVRRDADGIARQIDVLPADQKQLWQFTAVYKGVHYALQIRARLDDFGQLDLDFYVPDAIAKPVRSAVDEFLNKHGG
jgi:hypothetical protein